MCSNKLCFIEVSRVVETRFGFGGVKLTLSVAHLNTMPLLPLSGHLSTLHHHWNNVTAINKPNTVHVFDCHEI